MKEVAVRVSPPEGTRGVKVTRSVLREPIIEIDLGMVRVVVKSVTRFELLLR